MNLPTFFIICIITGYLVTWGYFARADKVAKRKKEIDAWMKGEGDTK